MDNRTLAQRIEIARRVKRESCGGREVTYEDLIESERVSAEGFRLDAVRSAEKSKASHGGIIGVFRVPGNIAKPFRAMVRSDGHQFASFFVCAISAMQYRNRLAERRWPGIDAFKCDEDAVWERWGCSCGEHERGKV